jgi:CubicO group peptidase (beta-lactamase class C family)
LGWGKGSAAAQTPAELRRRTKIYGTSDDEYGLLWWVMGEPKQAGYYALGFGGQLIIVHPKWRAVIVYVSDAQPDSHIDDKDMDPLNNVFISAFP